MLKIYNITSPRQSIFARIRLIGPCMKGLGNISAATVHLENLSKSLHECASAFVKACKDLEEVESPK